MRRIPIPRRSLVSLALAAALMVSLAACMGVGDAALNNNNQPPTDGSVTCQYALAVTPMSPQVGELVSVEVEMSGVCSPQPQDGYDWTLQAPDLSAIEPTLRQSGRIAEFTPTQAGTHSLEVVIHEIGGGQGIASRAVTVLDPQGIQQTLVLQLTPPPGADVPRQQAVLTVTGGTPVSGRVITLDQGVVVSNQLESEGAPFGGYLRFSQAGSSIVREVSVPATGAFQISMLGSALYNVTIIPDGASPAPLRLENRSVQELLVSDAFTLTPGEVVVGYVQEPGGAGIGAARAVLRTGELPSTVASSDEFDGRFILRARPGPQTLEVAPPAESAWPVATVSSATALELVAGRDMELRVRYHAVPTVDTSVQVSAGPAGSTVPVSDARVTFAATDLGPVASVQVSQDGSVVANVGAQGGFRVTAVTDAQGRVTDLALPAGTYRVVVDAPSDAPAGYGTTVHEGVVVSGSAALDLSLPLQSPALLEGWVVDELGAPVSDVEVVAVTGLGVGSAAQAFTDADGYFGLDVIQGATYHVLLVPDETTPPLSRHAVDAIVITDPVTTLQGTGPAGELVLSPGLRIAGQVVYLADGLGGVLLQAMDPTIPGEPVLAEAVTDLTGNFVLTVPDPGVLP